jgi:hypothetical protein
MRSMYGSFAEPFDPQRANPARRLTRTAESTGSRRFALAGFSATIAAGSLLSRDPPSPRRMAQRLLNTPLASPPVLPASADGAIPVDAAEMTPQSPSTACRQRQMAVCQNEGRGCQNGIFCFSAITIDCDGYCGKPIQFKWDSVSNTPFLKG